MCLVVPVGKKGSYIKMVLPDDSTAMWEPALYTVLTS